MKNNNPIAAFNLFLILALACGAANAQPVFFTDRSAFEAAATGLATERFDGGTPLLPGQVCPIEPPFAGANFPGACFAPGELLPGIAYVPNIFSSGGLLARVGPGAGGGFPGLTSNGLVFAPMAIMVFEQQGTTALGFDYFCESDTATVVVLGDIFDLDDVVTRDVPCHSDAPNFVGLTTTSDLFLVALVADSDVVAVDNVSFNGANHAEASATARFVVTKDFSDDNPAEVTVGISCNSGLPLEQSFTISESGEAFQMVTFTVADFVDGETECTVTEAPLEGYTTRYEAYGASTAVQDPDHPGCRFTGVSYGDQNTCAIGNELQPVPWTIAAAWEPGDQYGLEAQAAELEVSCENVRVERDGDLVDFIENVTLSPASPSFVYDIYPHHGMPASRCRAEVVSVLSWVELEQGCAQWQVFELGGEPVACSVTSTMFYEGVPALGHRGLALLALLMAGIGLAGLRRFA